MTSQTDSALSPDDDATKVGGGGGGAMKLALNRKCRGGVYKGHFVFHPYASILQQMAFLGLSGLMSEWPRAGWSRTYHLVWSGFLATNIAFSLLAVAMGAAKSIVLIRRRTLVMIIMVRGFLLTAWALLFLGHMAKLI